MIFKMTSQDYSYPSFTLMSISELGIDRNPMTYDFGHHKYPIGRYWEWPCFSKAIFILPVLYIKIQGQSASLP